MMNRALLYGILKNKSGAEISASGNPAVLEGRGIKDLKVFGWSEQKSTNGYQLIDTKNPVDGQEKTMNGITFTVLEDGGIKITGTATDDAAEFSFKRTYPKKKLKDNCSLIISANEQYTVNRVNFQNDIWVDGVYQSTVQQPGSKNDKRTFEGSIELGISRIVVPEGLTMDTVYYPMLEYGEVAHDFEPYTGEQPSPNPDYPQKIESAENPMVAVRGINLFNRTAYMDYNFISEKTLIINNRYPTIKVFKFDVKAKEKYSYTLEVLNNYTCAFGKDDDIDNLLVISGSFSVAKKILTVTVPDGYNAMYLCMQAEENRKMSVVKGEAESIPYEPYHEPQTISISTPNGLPGIPVNSGGNYTDANGQQWIADYVDLARGKYHQLVGRVNLWELTWKPYNVTTEVGAINGFRASKKLDRPYQSGLIDYMCNRYRPIIYRFSDYSNHTIAPYNTSNDNSIVIHDEDYTDVNAFKESLQGAILHYQLVEEKIIDLTPEELEAYKNLTTCTGTTIVENDQDCYMEVSSTTGDTLRAKKLTLLLGD